MSRMKIIYVLLLLFKFTLGQAQTEKVIKQQTQTWVSINTLTKFSDHWGIVADAHIRTNEIFHDTNFYFLRGFAYFYLVRLYGDVPLRLKPTALTGLACTKVAPTSASSPIKNEKTPVGIWQISIAFAIAWATNSPVPGWDKWPFASTGQPAAKADAVSPPATE